MILVIQMFNGFFFQSKDTQTVNFVFKVEEEMDFSKEESIILQWKNNPYAFSSRKWWHCFKYLIARVNGSPCSSHHSPPPSSSPILNFPPSVFSMCPREMFLKTLPHSHLRNALPSPLQFLWLPSHLSVSACVLLAGLSSGSGSTNLEQWEKKWIVNTVLNVQRKETFL